MLISAKEIINQSFDLYQKNYQTFFKYMLLLFMPAGVSSIAIALLGRSAAMIATFGFSVPLIIYFLLIILASLGSLWLTISFIQALKNSYLNLPNLTVRENIQKTVHLILPAIGVSILTSLIIFGGFLLLIIPAIIFALWYAFGLYAVILDNKKVGEALNYSKSLVKGRWWSVWWLAFAPAALFTLVLIFCQWLIGLPLESILKNFNFGETAILILVSIFALISTFVSLLFTPLSTAATVILYENLKDNPVAKKIDPLDPPQS